MHAVPWRSDTMNRLAILLLVGLLLLGHAVQAAPTGRLLVVAEPTPIDAAIVDALRDALEERARGLPIEVITPAEAATRLARPDPALPLVVTVGSRAAAAARTVAPGYQVLHTTITARFYREFEDGMPPAERARHTALFLDQPADRQLLALNSALPQMDRIGVLTSHADDPVLGTLIVAAHEYAIAITVAEVKEQRFLITRLEELLRGTDLLLVTPDTEIYNSYSLRNVLLTAYRQRKPVIGVSAAYVKAGALLAVHSTPVTIGQDAAELVGWFLDSGRLPGPRAPLRFEVSINHQVARSLGLSTRLPDAQVLAERLRELERMP